MKYNVTRDSEMSKGYNLYNGITMGSSILATWLLPKTIQVARDSIRPTLLLATHPQLLPYSLRPRWDQQEGRITSPEEKHIAA